LYIDCKINIETLKEKYHQNSVYNIISNIIIVIYLLLTCYFVVSL
jgi:hypothetical protein